MHQANLFNHNQSVLNSDLKNRFYNACSKNDKLYQASIKNLNLNIKIINFFDKSNDYYITVTDLFELPLLQTRGIGPESINSINIALEKLLEKIEKGDCNNIIFEIVPILNKQTNNETNTLNTPAKVSKYSLIEKLSIDYLDIDIRIINSLKKGNCYVIKDLLNKQINNIQGIGYIAINKINNAIEKIYVNKLNSIPENFESKSFSDHLTDILNSLTEKEKGIIVMRFGLENNSEMTLEEIGALIGVTRERIRQIEEKIIRKLRHPSKRVKLKIYLETILKNSSNKIELNKLFQDYNTIASIKLLSKIFPKDIMLYSNELLTTSIIIRPEEINRLDILVQDIHNLLSDQIGSVNVKEIAKHFNCDTKYITNQKDTIVYKGLIVLKNNKKALGKDRKFEVLKLLKDNPRPVHISEIMERTSLKDREVRTLLERLKKYDNVVNVGPSLFSLEEFGYKNLATKKLLISLLMEAKEPLNINTIIKSIQNRRVVKKNTIIAALNDKSIFKKPFSGYVSLNKW